jgi:hypothetical protein
MLGEDLRLSIALAAQPRIMRGRPKSIGNPAAASKVFWRIVERMARQSARSLILMIARTNSGESKILELQPKILELQPTSVRSADDGHAF